LSVHRYKVVLSVLCYKVVLSVLLYVAILSAHRYNVNTAGFVLGTGTDNQIERTKC
jgi:hypothetical protein